MKKFLISVALLISTVISCLAGTIAPLQLSAAELDEDLILDVEELSALNVATGTSLTEIIAMLPDTVALKMKDPLGQGQTLHTAGFDTDDWTLYDASAVTLDGNKLTVNKASGKVKALAGGEYSDVVVEATLRAPDQNLHNNYGIMIRASGVTDQGGDSYNGYYIGIGTVGGKYSLVIGYADGSWHILKTLPITYQHNTDYSLKVMAYGKTLAVWLDGELMYNQEHDLFSSGRVGLRTYCMLFECSSFVARTPSDADLAAAGLSSYTQTSAELNAWSCEDFTPNKDGTYTFKTTVKGTSRQVTCAVNVRKLLKVNEELRALSTKNVAVTDGFFRDYIKLMICEAVPTAIANVEKPEGGMPNIINAAKKNRGEEYGAFQGMFYVDSDVHKVLESMCFALSIAPMGDQDIISAQQEIALKLEEWIPYFLDAQEDTGYLDTYYSLNPDKVKLSNVSDHELYCMGHFIEAAIAHYQYTDGSDTRLMDAAIKIADYINSLFGPGKKSQIPGHQEIELALLRLADTVAGMGGATADKAPVYIELSAFLLGTRGKGTSVYWQDHAKVEDQTSAVGHAVRAQYMYTAMAGVAARDDEYREKYNNALSSLWYDVTYSKQYVTGGVGQVAATESFGDPYYLPNIEAYCETCAGIANMLWNRSMSELYTGSAFADRIETDLYNAVLGCISLDGDKFFYANSLASQAMRKSWFGTACCPPNLTRNILSVGGYIYNVGSDSLYVNQYISNKASTTLSGADVGINMTSEMPNSGKGSISLSMAADTDFRLYIRMPYWSDSVTVKINGTPVEKSANSDGYILLGESWSDGDTVEFEFSMPVIFEETDEAVTSNIGYTSVRRGPLVYCAESTDNSFGISRAYVDKTSEITLQWKDSLDGKADPYNVRDMYLIKIGGYVQGITKDTPVEWTFVPFYARLNREQDPMAVYVAKEPLKNKTLESFAKPSASHTYHDDSIYHLNDGTEYKSLRWTCYSWSDVKYDPWVQYDFDEPVTLSGCKIWWYDDKGGVQLASSCEIYYKNGESDELVKIENGAEFLCTGSESFDTYTFGEDITLTTLRVVMKNRTSGVAPGIVEWQLIASDTEDKTEPPTDGKEDGENKPSVNEDNEKPLTSDSTKPTESSTTASSSVKGGNSTDEENSSLWVWIAIPSVAVLIAAAIVVLIIKKRKI